MAQLSKDEKQKMKTALKIKKSLEKEMDEHNLGMSSPESEDVDFKKVIHPLGYYIHDREQMIEEMFSIIREEKLRRMLPPLLKNYSLEELKADCLVHLLGMSRKRILAIVEGRELNSSSDSESESSTITSESDETMSTNKADPRLNVDDDDLLDISVSEKDINSLIKDKSKPSNLNSKKTKSRPRSKIKIEKDVPVCSILISDEELGDSSSKKSTKRKHESASNKLDQNLNNKRKSKKREKQKGYAIGNSGEFSDNVQQITLVHNESVSPNIKEKGKTLLEILELEMRARAIRALLKNTPDSEEIIPAPPSNLKSEKENVIKTDPKISSVIADVIDQTLSDKSTVSAAAGGDVSESGNDVEIIDITDVDLCVTINDDDEITDSHQENDAPKTDTNEKRELSVEEKVEKSTSVSDSNENQFENSTKSDSEKTELTENQPEYSEDATVKDNVSWPERWAEKKNVKEFVKNSKICANIRKRMRFARMLKQKQVEEGKQKDDQIDFNNVEESSVAQYDLIKAHTSKNTETNNENSSSIDEQSSNELIETQPKCNENNCGDISAENHALTIIDDTKTLIIDLSDDDVSSIAVPADDPDKT